MLVGIISPFSFQNSNVKDDTPTLDDLLQDCQSPIFSKDLEISDGESIYSYEEDESFTPRVWEDSRENNGDYDLDEVLFVPCNLDSSSPQYANAGKLIKVTGKDGSGFEKHERPYEPEEYGSYDDGMEWKSYSERYMRVKAFDKDLGVTDRQWHNANRWYYFFYEDRGACGSPGAWRWSAKDKTATGERTFTMYLRTCMSHDFKYNAAKDIKAVYPNWVAPTGSAKEETYQFRSMLERGGYFYFRTHLNVPIKYRSWTTGEYQYSYMIVASPYDIQGVVYKRNTNALNPFDGKGYTKAIIDTTETAGIASWNLLATNDFNSIALGNIMASSVDILIKSPDGEELFVLNNYFIQNEVDEVTDIEEEVTRTIYSKTMFPSESMITIVIHGDVVSIGEIVGAKSLDAGMTNVAFKNKVKDYSPSEEDPWGNYYYRQGMKTHIHTGIVSLPIVRYDQLVRLMKKIGGQPVVINSSDTFENEAPDGRHVFAATMMIARFTLLELDSAEKNKRIGEKAKYNFVIKELIAFMGLTFIGLGDFALNAMSVL